MSRAQRGLAVPIAAALAVMLVTIGVEQRAVLRAGARDARRCGDTIVLGDSSRVLEDKLRADACAELKSFTTDDEHGRKTWLADAPMVLGARNWRLRIEVVDEAVTAVRYRTADSSREHPSAAPDDRVR